MLAKDDTPRYQTITLINPSVRNETATEADHRIANSLMLVTSLLRMQAKELGKRPVVTGADAKDALDEAAARIDAVGQLHRLLAALPESEVLDSGEYLRSIGEAAARAAAARTAVRLSYELAGNLPVDCRRLMTLGMLTSEAIINALKHAHPSGVAGEITLSFRKIGSDGVLVVEDDGVGLPEGFDPARDGGLGFKTMRQLALRLQARMIHRSTPLGLRVEVIFAL